MGKIVNVPAEAVRYNHNTAYFNSPIGQISNVTGDPYTFEVSNIKVSEVRAALGENTYKISELCTSSKINPYALFRPSGSPPYKLSDFAGYNHGAVATTDYYSIPGPYSWTGGGNKLVVTLITTGERPPVSPKSWDRVRVKLYVPATGNVYYSDIKDISDGGNFTEFPVYVNFANEDLSGSIQITGQYMDASSNVIGTIEGGVIHASYSVSKEWILITADLFTTTITEVRAYYTYMNSLFGFSGIGSAKRSSGFFAGTGGSGNLFEFPERVMYNNNYHYWTGIIYGKIGTQLYKFSASPINPYFTGDAIDNDRKVGPDVGACYVLGSVTQKTAYPTDINDL